MALVRFCQENVVINHGWPSTSTQSSHKSSTTTPAQSRRQGFSLRGEGGRGGGWVWCGWVEGSIFLACGIPCFLVFGDWHSFQKLISRNKNVVNHADGMASTTTPAQTRRQVFSLRGGKKAAGGCGADGRGRESLSWSLMFHDFWFWGLRLIASCVSACLRLSVCFRLLVFFVRLLGL